MENRPMLLDRLIEGIRAGIDKHWRYQKTILEVKPEYLFTVATADAIAKGFDGISGLDLKIHLEKSVHQIVGQSLMSKVGFKSYFSKDKELLERAGKADICIDLEFGTEIYIVELKGLNPNATEVKKEIKRFVDFLTVYSGNTSIKFCYLSFPSTFDAENWIVKRVEVEELPSSLGYEFSHKGYETGEEPEDGIPYFYANVLRIHRV